VCQVVIRDKLIMGITIYRRLSAKPLLAIHPFVVVESPLSEPTTLVSGNIRFMQIFAGVPWRGGVKRQWGNRKQGFSGLSDATSSAPWEMRPTSLYSII